MKNHLFRKGLVLGLMILFVGASIIPSINGNIEQVKKNEVRKTLNNNIEEIGLIVDQALDYTCGPTQGSHQIKAHMPIGQSFKPLYECHYGIELYITQINPESPLAPIQITLKENNISGPIVPETNVTLNLTSGSGWRFFEFDSPINLTINQTYVIDISTTTSRWGAKDTGGFCYTRGIGYLLGSPHSGIDLYFRTYVLNPYPMANFTYQPDNPTIYDIIYFNDTSNDFNGYIVSWLWDFGDGNISILQNTSHQYTNTGTYVVTLEVTDNDELTDEISKNITVTYKPPNVPSQPYGNTSGYICINHNYSTSTTDPAEFNISYGWDWDGDLVVDEWTDWYESNETCKIAHNWSDPGKYNVSVKAKNTFQEESNWSSKLSVTMLNHLPHVPSDPIPPDGATNVPVDAVLCWTGGDPDICDTVTYDVYFGMNYPPSKQSSNQTETCYDPYGPDEMPFVETFYWGIVAWDNHGDFVISPIWTFTTEHTLPPLPPEIDGPTSGKPDINYEFSFVSTHPQNLFIKYYVDWDDGYITETDYYEAGEVVTLNHKWDSKNIFTIAAKAIDIYENESDWSEFDIEIPRTRATFYSLIHWFLERFPILERILNLIKTF